MVGALGSVRLYCQSAMTMRLSSRGSASWVRWSGREVAMFGCFQTVVSSS